MQVDFAPIDDTYSSLREKLIEKASEYGFVDSFESGSGFASVVTAYMDYDNPKVKEFIKWAKRFCQVKADL